MTIPSFFQVEISRFLANITYLSADDSMKLLFNDGNGSVYKMCVTWLSSGDQHLEISGCLAVGNFGRTGRRRRRGGWKEKKKIFPFCYVLISQLFELILGVSSS